MKKLLLASAAVIAFAGGAQADLGSRRAPVAAAVLARLFPGPASTSVATSATAGLPRGITTLRPHSVRQHQRQRFPRRRSGRLQLADEQFCLRC